MYGELCCTVCVFVCVALCVNCGVVLYDVCVGVVCVCMVCLFVLRV